MLSKILIIDKRKELPAKYKKNLENPDTSVTITNNLKDAFNDIQTLEPDMIIVSDSINESLSNFCEKIRALTCNTRPVIIALSKSADSGDRILVLDSGADDFLSEPVNIEEFKTRIRAHLRRDIELNLDTKTLLPNRKISEKSLKRIINSSGSQAVLLVGVENLENYKSVYSDIASDKLIQTFVAITKSALEPEDFLGQINETNFIIITNAYKAEKIAAFLTFAFDTVAPKFYSEQDAKRGYMLMKSDRLAGMRANFVSVHVGCILGNYEHINSVEGLMERLFSIKKTAKTPGGSNYVIDRIKLTDSKTEPKEPLFNHIYIKEPDDALALLLRTTLELQGYDVTETINTEDSSQPSILIIDSGDNLEELELCREIKYNPNFANSKIIVTTSVHDKAAVLDSGVDLYLPKPYELTELVQWIEYFNKHTI